jgi:hypothetical protein
MGLVFGYEAGTLAQNCKLPILGMANIIKWNTFQPVCEIFTDQAKFLLFWEPCINHNFCMTVSVEKSNFPIDNAYPAFNVEQPGT